MASDCAHEHLEEVTSQRGACRGSSLQLAMAPTGSTRPTTNYVAPQPLPAPSSRRLLCRPSIAVSFIEDSNLNLNLNLNSGWCVRCLSLATGLSLPVHNLHLPEVQQLVLMPDQVGHSLVQGLNHPTSPHCPVVGAAMTRHGSHCPRAHSRAGWQHHRPIM